MDFQKFYVTQIVIDDLRNTNKRAPKKLVEVILLPIATDFLMCKKLNLIDLCKFYNVLDLKISKRLVIERLDSLKYESVGLDKKFRLPTKYLQNIADYIESFKERLTDFEYRHDLEYLMKFY